MAAFFTSLLRRFARPASAGSRASLPGLGLAALLVFLAAAGLYLPVLDHKFVADDFSLIVDNEFISDPGSFSFVFDREFFSRTHPIKLGARPLALLSLMADSAAWGLDPFGYHLTNIVLHGLNSALVLLLVFSLWRKAAPPEGSAPNALPSALFAALLFALHPLQAEAVSVAAFRADLLCAFFSLLSLLAFSRAAYAAALGAMAFALFSKETAVVLPFLALLQVLFFRRENKAAALRGRAAYVALAAAAAALFLAYYWADRFNYPLRNVVFPAITGNISPLSSVSAYVNTIAAALLHYGAKLLLPRGLSLEYQLTLPAVLLSGKVLLALGAAAAAAMVFRSGAGVPLKFSLGFFLVSYLPASNLVPLVNTVSDRYMYLPMAGFAMLAAASLDELRSFAASRSSAVSLARHFPAIAAAAGAVLLVLYAWGAASQAARFSDMFPLYRAAAGIAPANPNARYNLALAYVERGEHAAAAGELEALSAVSPLYRRGEVWHLQGFCAEKLGDNKRARAFYAKVLLAEPRKETYNNLANLLQREGNGEGAAWLLKKSLEMFPDPVSSNNLGTYYASKSRFKEAAKYFRQAVNLRPDYTDAWFNLLNACEASGDLEGLRRETDRMARLFHENGWEVGYAR